MERKIRSIYREANKDLTKKTKEYFDKFKEADAKKRKLVETGALSKKDYREWRKNKMLMGRHWERMKDQTARSLHNANKIANEYVNGRLPNIYAINYNGEAELAEAGLSGKFSFEMANQQTIKELIDAGDKNLLPQRKLDPKKDIPWNMQRVNSAVLQGIIQGESIPKIAARISAVATANKVQSIRAARTIVTQVENKAVHDVAKRADENGAVVYKSWLATSDGRTRDWHSDADSDYGTKDTAIPWNEPFVVMGEDMMYPGDGSGSPENVYNCRCSSRNWYMGFKRTLPKGTIKVVSFKWR